jgi:hypothetical protein
MMADAQEMSWAYRWLPENERHLTDDRSPCGQPIFDDIGTSWREVGVDYWRGFE